MTEIAPHPVIEEIRRRQRGDSPQFRLAVAYEGGSIRCCTVAGMSCAMKSSGISSELADARHGSSGGTHIASYVLSDRINSGTAMFYEDNNGGEFIDVKQVITRQRPMLSLDHVLETVMGERKPIDFKRIVDSQRLHVLATRVSDLSRHIFAPATSVEELKEQIRASSTIPFFAGDPVRINGEEFIDASLSEPLPYIAPLEEGYDAVLLLSSRPNSHTNPDSPSFTRKVLDRMISKQFKKIHPDIMEAIRDSELKIAGQLKELREMSENPDGPPYVLSVHPPESAQPVWQIDKNPERIIAGTIAGYLAMKRVLGDPEPHSFTTEGSFEGVYS